MRGICFEQQMAMMCSDSGSKGKTNPIIPDTTILGKDEAPDLPFNCQSTLLQREIIKQNKYQNIEKWLCDSEPYFNIKDRQLEQERVRHTVAALILRKNKAINE